MKKLAFVMVISSIAVVANSMTFTDDFNRADSADLGPNWQVIGANSATRVISNQAGNVAGESNLSLVTTGNFSAAYTDTLVEADIQHSGVSGLGYIALAFGHNGGTSSLNGLYIKVQSSGTEFNQVGFYTGVNGTSTAAWPGGGNFFGLTTTFSRAHMSVYAMDATTIAMDFDTNFDNVVDQHLTKTLDPGVMTFGTQVGLAVFGTNVNADNFVASTPVPEPASLAALSLGAIALVRRRRR